MKNLSAHITGFVKHSKDQEFTADQERPLPGNQNQDKYFLLFNSLNQGFCVIEIFFNENGKAVDWIFREANPAVGKQTGLKDVAGRRFSEVAPDEEQKWKDKLAGVALTGKPAEFIEYSKTLNKWFEVSAVPFGDPGKHQVAVLFSDVTGKKAAEEVLNESRERYQALIETNVDFIWEIDHEGRYTYCSPQMKDLWGLSPEDSIGKSPFDHLPDCERSKNLDILRKIIKKAAPFTNLDFTSRDGSGNIIHLEASGIPFFSYLGDLSGFRGITKDVTAQRREEEQLRKSEMNFRTIVETANEGVFKVDQNHNLVYVNNKITEMSGFRVEELIGQPVLFFVSNDESSRFLKIIPQVQKGIRRNFEFKLIRKDHDEINTSVNVTPLYNNKGEFDGYFGMMTDITDRVMIERDLKKTRRKLQTALRNANIGTWEWNLKTIEFTYDRRAEEIFCIRPGTFDNSPAGLTGFIHEEDLSYVNTSLKCAISDGTPFEAIFRTKPVNEKCNYVLAKATISRDRKGNPLLVSGVCFDVTEMKEGAEKTLIRLNEDLLRSNRDLQQFAYVASHDLQEPLRMVSSFTQLLQQKYAGKLDSDANDYINFAVSGSRRMYELLNGLLAYSRIQTRGREFEEVDLKLVVEKVKANIKLLIEESDARVDCHKLPVVKADENQMIQLMQNIIENAIKFTKGKPIVTISAASKGDFQVISVKDNGIGIEPVYFEKIFRIFQRLHHSELPGTGIGLAICQRIIERHGGKIWVNSNPGEGSVFSFSLPDTKKPL